MKNRSVQTRFWDDEIVVELSARSKYLFIYLLTSQYINISGAFQLSDKKIQFETALTDKELSLAKEELTKYNRVKFMDGWVYVVNAEKNNNYRATPNNEKSYQTEWSQVPARIKEYFLSDDPVSNPLLTPYEPLKKGLLTPHNHNHNNNHKEGGVGGDKPIDSYVNRFNELFGTKTIVTEGRVRKLGLRLRKYSVSQILEALENLSMSEFHRGNNDRGWKADPDFLINSDERVDKWLNAKVSSTKFVPESKDPLVRAARERMSV